MRGVSLAAALVVLFGTSESPAVSQIFHKSFNVLSRASIAVALIGAGAVVFLLMRLDRSGWNTGEKVVLEQPIKFSHAHHVSAIGIDCRYCHTSVEESSFAGIPPTATCMNCHSQIWNEAPMLEPVRASFRDGTSIEWRRVHDLPDFAYFNHSIHVAQGVGCVTCHDQVDRMPLTWRGASLQMAWCLDCHRDPARYVRPREAVFDPLWELPEGQTQRELGERLVAEYGIENPQHLTSCSTCHR